MARTLIEVRLPDGCAAALIVPWMDLERMDWQEYLGPLADLLAHEQEAEWSFIPIPDEVDDKAALLGH